jgi:ketosteroid isomerase-like protein
MCEMGGALEGAMRQLFDALDRKDVDAIVSAGAEDIQSVDEITRRWLRGKNEFAAYIRQLVDTVDDVHTTLSDVHETVQGDVGLMTCWLDQDYRMEGKLEHVSAPTTVAFRRDSNAWKIMLFHSVPLPPQET